MCIAQVLRDGRRQTREGPNERGQRQSNDQKGAGRYASPAGTGLQNRHKIVLVTSLLRASPPTSNPLYTLAAVRNVHRTLPFPPPPSSSPPLMFLRLIRCALVLLSSSEVLPKVLPRFRVTDTFISLPPTFSTTPLPPPFPACPTSRPPCAPRPPSAPCPSHLDPEALLGQEHGGRRPGWTRPDDHRLLAGVGCVRVGLIHGRQCAGVGVPAGERVCGVARASSHETHCDVWMQAPGGYHCREQRHTNFPLDTFFARCPVGASTAAPEERDTDCRGCPVQEVLRPCPE